jgi:hypothetical protein
MNASKLLKLAPTLTMAAAMVYAAYSINPPAPATLQAATPKPAPAGSGGDRPTTNAAGGPAARKASLSAPPPRARNPFVALFKPNRTGKAGTSQEARVDPNLALVKGLTLNATFVQGATQYASINGRLYSQGQHLDGADDRATSLVITQVTSAQVTLEADGNRYTLAYPDQLTAGAGPQSTAAARLRSTAGATQRGGRLGPPGRSALPRR